MDTIYNSYLGKTLTVRIDRALGSRHPKHKFIYPINYGYIPNTKAGDGHEIDAYIIGVFHPLETYDGVCLGYIKRYDDVECKLIVAPIGKLYTSEQISALVEFQEQRFNSEVIMQA